MATHFGTDLASVSRDRARAEGSGKNALAVVNLWIVANPAGDGSALLAYLDSIAGGVLLLDLGGVWPSSQVAGMQTLVSLAGIREKVRQYIDVA